MELRMKHVMELLKVPEKEVLRRIKEKQLPARKLNHQYVFNEQEIREWAVKNGVEMNSRLVRGTAPGAHVSAASLMQKGGFIYGLKGRTVGELLGDAVTRMRLPDNLKKQDVLDSLLEREDMMPTAVGSGIAIPHPRKPLITEVKNESITVCLLSHPINYSAPDKKPVHTMFIVLSANHARHLHILAGLLYLCQQEPFTALLSSNSAAADIMKAAFEIEDKVKGE